MISLASEVPLLAASQTNGGVEVLNLTNGTTLRNWRAHTMDSRPVLDISRAGKWLATGNRAGEVKLWDTAIANEVAHFGPVESGVATVRLSPDAKTLAASTLSGRVWLWNIPSRRPIGQFDLERDYSVTMAFSPDGELLGVARENEVFLWDVRASKLKTLLKGHLQEVRAIVFSPDGRTLATGSDDQKLKLWHLATLQELMTFTLDGECKSLKFSTDGRVLACGLRKNSSESIQLWRAPAITEIDAEEKIPGGGHP